MAASGGKKKRTPRLLRKEREVAVSFVVRTNLPLSVLRDKALTASGILFAARDGLLLGDLEAESSDIVAEVDEKPSANVLQPRRGGRS